MHVVYLVFLLPHTYAHDCPMVLSGPACRVGKSCLLSRCASKWFSSEHKPSDCMDFVFKEIVVEDRNVILQVRPDRRENMSVWF